MKLKFTDVSEEAGISGPIQSFPCWFFDYNNDGWLDIMNFSYSANVSDDDIPAEYLNKPKKVINLQFISIIKMEHLPIKRMNLVWEIVHSL